VTSSDSPDAGRWVDWLVTFTPSQNAESDAPHPLVTRMQKWARDDPASADAWLDRMADCPLKDQASATYNEGLARLRIFTAGC